MFECTVPGFYLPLSTMKCPICKKEVPLSSPGLPFCSERCRLIDLGKWADGAYVISTPEDKVVLPPPAQAEDDD